MPIGRRETLALTGAFLAGLAGCTGSEEAPATRATTRETTVRRTTIRDTTTGDGTTTEENSDFEDLDAPPFPQIDPVTDPEVPEDALARQIRGNVAFAFDLLEVLREQADEPNLFVSPYSVSVALAMTWAGARGGTEREMADALNFALDQERLHPAFGSLEAEFERRNEDGRAANVRTASDDEDAGPAFEFTTANAVWGQDGYPFREAFLDLLEAYYGAGLQLVDFEGDPEAARQRINDWVAERTNDRIEDLVPKESIGELTRLVLTNAIYFRARWRHPFDEETTEPRPFRALDGTTTEVATMHQSVETQYAEIGGHQLVELPYANRQTSMVVVLPAEGAFESFERNFSVDRLAVMLDRTEATLVDLALPTFEVESSFSLVEAMRALGMERAFTGSADFSGMAEGGGLSISDVVHQSFVAVDELGTEAAAATAVVVEASAPARRAEMTVDRPFLFYIRDRPTETPLFVGRVTDLPADG
ncbi:serpin family protein [Halobacteriales archaeon QS_1_67_19]|nr:MAG: serpin family protein [Halobacteriales archaeon QS_1_67_19]